MLITKNKDLLDLIIGIHDISTIVEVVIISIKHRF